MRILHTLDYWAEGYGRPEAVCNLARLQREAGHEVLILVADQFGGEEEAMRNFSSEEVELHRTTYRSRDPEWREWLLGRAEDFQPDIAHTHELADGWALAGNMACPVVLSLRVDYRKRAEREELLEAAHLADWVEYWNPDILGWLRQGSVAHTSWNCAPVVVSEEERVRKRNLIVSQGRIDDVKNQRELVRAMPEILRFVPEAKLWLVGDGPGRADLEQLAEQLRLREVRFMGWQKNPVRELARAHLAVYPGIRMGFERAIMEAMWVGVPTICSPELSPVIHYGKYGTVAEPGQLAETIIRALLDDNLEEGAVRAREYAQQHYSPSAVLERTEAVYKKLLADIDKEDPL